MATDVTQQNRSNNKCYLQFLYLYIYIYIYIDVHFDYKGHNNKSSIEKNTSITMSATSTLSVSLAS